MQQGEETDRIFSNNFSQRHERSPFLEVWTALKLLLNVEECLKLWILDHTTLWRTNGLKTWCKNCLHARFRTKIVPELYEQDKKKVMASSVALTAAGCTTESYVTVPYITVEWKMRCLVLSGFPLLRGPVFHSATPQLPLIMLTTKLMQ